VARFVRQRRSLERARFYIDDAMAASRHHLAGGFRGKFDEMPRRLIVGAAAQRDTRSGSIQTPWLYRRHE
jgi:hypothetical protein